MSDIIKMQILLNFSLTLTYQRTILIYTHKIHSLILELNPIENNLYFQRKIVELSALNHSKVARVISFYPTTSPIDMQRNPTNYLRTCCLSLC